MEAAQTETPEAVATPDFVEAPAIPECSSDSVKPKTSISQSQHRDGMREIRAMVVAALPCPPMPVMASRELEGESSFTDSAGACCSSHDLIAHLMNIACTCATERQNKVRAELQIKLHAELFDEVDEWRRSEPDPKIVLPPVDWSYRVLGNFTRRYIQSYMPDPSREQDVRFIPLHEIDRTHFVHARALEYQKAQDTMYGKCRAVWLRGYDVMSYAELVQMSILRIIESSNASASCLQEACERV